jgi:hypothetical protein
MITIDLSLTEASLVLSALRDVSSRANVPQLEAVIDNLHSAYVAAEDEVNYRHQPEDAGLDSYWESQTELPEYDY